ncbi:MAG: MBL fold metallo-hydrolase [Nitrososphaeraceae archaeon]
MEYNDIEFKWLGHDGYKIEFNNKIIYIDPYKISERYHSKYDGDIILISHDHFDHLSFQDLKHLASNNTQLFVARECIEKLENEGFNKITSLEPFQKIKYSYLDLEALPAYNINKNFHPKNDNKLGFMITINNTRIYHCGDTDAIPEMSGLNPDIAFVPVSGTYVMTAEEAAKAVNELIRPSKMAIPMHYGSIVGNLEDAIKFKEMTNICEVRILEPE